MPPESRKLWRRLQTSKPRARSSEEEDSVFAHYERWIKWVPCDDIPLTIAIRRR